MTAGLCAVQLAANAGAQAARFGLCLACGLVAGVVGLLYLRRARPIERALTDLFATLFIAAGLVACVEFVLGGAPEPYGVVAYILGACALPFATKKLKARRAKKRENADKN